MTKEIPLTQGYVALVDDEDYERIIQRKWNVMKHGNNFYGHGHRKIGQGIYKKELLHRVVLNAPKGTIVDHKNGNGLDCRKENLRFSDHSGNMHNSGKRKKNTSGYKGVGWVAHCRKWKARICHHRVEIYLGLYENAQEAAKAYDEAAKVYHGEFARLNFG